MSALCLLGLAPIALLIVALLQPSLPLVSISQVESRTGIRLPTGSRLIRGYDHISWHGSQYSAIEIPPDSKSSFVNLLAALQMEEMESADWREFFGDLKLVPVARGETARAFSGYRRDGEVRVVITADASSRTIVYVKWVAP